MSATTPTADLILETLNAYQRAEALRSAIELDLFSAVGEGRRTATEIASRCRASPRGVRILCDGLVVLGLLRKRDGRYDLTDETSTYLDRRSPSYIGEAIEFLASPTLRRGFERLTAAVRKGGTALDENGTLRPEHEVWERFARGMAPVMASTAEALAELIGAGSGPLKILDLAAGHGLFGIAFARRNPEAHVHAVDWPSVLRVAESNARKAGVSDRFHGTPGDLLRVDPGSGYDLALLANIVHHFDRATTTGLLRRVGEALRPGGQLVLLEYVPDEDRVSPSRAAGFALVMLATTPSGDAYTFAEYREMFREVGLSNDRMLELPGSSHRVVVAFRPSARNLSRVSER